MKRPAASAPPRLLDPILAVVEWIDRGVRRVRPIRPGGMVGIEHHRHRGAPVRLRDGTVVHRGDRAWVLHLDNRLVHGISAAGWQTDGYRAALDDLRALAVWHARQPDGRRPLAYTGLTLLGPLARRAGMEIHPRPRTAWTRVEDWYLRSLLARWARGGRCRLARGRRPLVAEQVWISGAELLRRYGEPPPE